MSQAALFSLDEPKPLAPRGRAAWAVGITGYALLTAVVIHYGDITLQPLVWVPVAHALAISFVCAFTAVLLLGQATTSGLRGYLWLGASYLYVGGLLLAFPLFFPGTVWEGEPLVGGTQSAITIFYVWHLAFLVGIIASGIVLWKDRRNHRRPGLRHRLWVTVVAVIGAVLATLILVAALPNSVPLLLGDGGSLTLLARATDVLMVALSAIAVGLAATTVRTGAQIQRWLFAVTLLLLGEALVNATADGRWTLAWYFNRFFGMVSLAAMFAALVWIIARIGRATSRLAASDSLTGAESRASFGQSMERELAAAGQSGTRRAVLWIDLDGFKSVNDQVGHAVGDEVLRRTVQRLRANVRASDHVGRLGGDEFGVLLCDNVADERISVVADRLLRALREPVVVEDTTTLLSGSIGVSVSPGDGQDADTLLQRADLAMYAAKHAGGDRYRRFTDELGEEAGDKADLRYRLARGIRQHEFALDVQPIVAAADRRVVGLEALVRWQTGTDRLVAARFIDFSMQSGQIIQIGRQVVARLEELAPALLRTLPAEGFLSFNLSVKELTDTSIVDRLTRGPLAKLSPRMLVEVTESLEFQALTDAAANLDRLRLSGFRVAVDDFGAGFSNFARLEQLQPYVLKADRSLVSRLTTDGETGSAFLQATVSVARSLQCRVIAEGVENQRQAALVEEMGVDLVQGYFYGRPVPAPAWLGEHAAQGAAV